MNKTDQTAVEHAHADGQPIDWTPIMDAIAEHQPFQPDAYHRLTSGGKVETIDLRYRKLDSFPADTDTFWDVFEAWCWFTNHFSNYHRDTLAFSVAGLVERLAWNEDNFQKGMMAIIEELDELKTKYRNDKDVERLHPDDVQKYLIMVAYNAMRGRKRKPVLVGSDLVKDTEAPVEEKLLLKELLQGINNACTQPLDLEILRLKAEKFSEAEIGEMTGKSRDYVQRRLSCLYKDVCARAQLEPTPMGRSPRRSRGGGGAIATEET